MNTRLLPVKLTLEQHKIRAQELAAAVSEKNDLDVRKKTFASAIKSEAEAIDARILGLLDKVRTGREHAEVEVTERRNFEARRVETIRIDTNEIVEYREMTQEELQHDLPFIRAVEPN